MYIYNKISARDISRELIHANISWEIKENLVNDAIRIITVGELASQN